MVRKTLEFGFIIFFLVFFRSETLFAYCKVGFMRGEDRSTRGRASWNRVTVVSGMIAPAFLGKDAVTTASTLFSLGIVEIPLTNLVLSVRTVRNKPSFFFPSIYGPSAKENGSPSA